MTDGGYHDDTDEAERTWRRVPDGPQSWLVLASMALTVVGGAAVLGWAWFALRSQGLFGESLGWSDQEVALLVRIDLFVNTLDRLVLAVLAVAIGLALRRHAEANATDER